MGSLRIKWPPRADLDVWVFGCQDVIGLPLHPTYKCSFHCVNEMAWEQPSLFTTVWLYIYEACCWLQAEKQLSPRASGVVHMKLRALHSAAHELKSLLSMSEVYCSAIFLFPFLPGVQTSPVPVAEVSLCFKILRLLSSLRNKQSELLHPE